MKQFLFNRLPVFVFLLFPGALFAQSSNSIVPSYVYAKLEYYKLHYSKPPLAADGFITATPNSTVSGNVFGESRSNLTAYLLTGSPDGNVKLSADGAFTFTPDVNFNSSSTSFSYKACDSVLCSETATITIHFPRNSRTMVTELAANVNDDNTVTLNWARSAENSNNVFDIERSMDGEHFTKVGTVEGSDVHYSFINKVSRQTASKNDLYYRLHQMTADGQSVTSKVLIVRVYKTKYLQSLSLTPNSEINALKINAQLNESSYVVMKVVNDAGIEVMRQSVKSPQGVNSYTLAGSNELEKGTYFLEMIVNSNERMMVKLMKD